VDPTLSPESAHSIDTRTAARTVPSQFLNFRILCNPAIVNSQSIRKLAFSESDNSVTPFLNSSGAAVPVIEATRLNRGNSPRFDDLQGRRASQQGGTSVAMMP
jgi:hypothetical protein